MEDSLLALPCSLRLSLSHMIMTHVEEQPVCVWQVMGLKRAELLPQSEYTLCLSVLL